MNPDSIHLRDVLMRGIRAFFYERDYTEVETPIRLKIPCMELHIDAIPSGDHFLRTSPEMFHKRLLASGLKRIFEVGKCFRSEEMGPLHHPEYTMLEWYQAGADYLDMLEETRLLISRVWKGVSNDWKIWTVSDAFLEYAGWDPVGNYSEDRFDVDLVEKIEPAFKEMGGPVVLIDYPVEAAALSRKKAENALIAERWELYIDGVELANAYSELTDPAEQRARFEECARQRIALGKEAYEIDEAFIHALEKMPPSGGVALGVDRLIMLISGSESLDDIISNRSGH